MASAQPKTAEHAVKQTARTIAQQSRKVADQAAETKHAAAAAAAAPDPAWRADRDERLPRARLARRADRHLVRRAARGRACGAAGVGPYSSGSVENASG